MLLRITAGDVRSLSPGFRERVAPRALPDTQIVPGAHRKAVRRKTRDADDDDGPGRQRAAGDARDHGEGRDETVVGAVNQIADVMPGDSCRTLRPLVQCR